MKNPCRTYQRPSEARIIKQGRSSSSYAEPHSLRASVLVKTKTCGVRERNLDNCISPKDLETANIPLTRSMPPDVDTEPPLCAISRCSLGDDAMWSTVNWAADIVGPLEWWFHWDMTALESPTFAITTTRSVTYKIVAVVPDWFITLPGEDVTALIISLWMSSKEFSMSVWTRFFHTGAIVSLSMFDSLPSMTR